MVKESKDYKLYLSIGLFLFYIIGNSSQWLKFNSQKLNHQKVIPPLKQLKLFSFGYRELIADLLWIQAIQNLDECGLSLLNKDYCNYSVSFKRVDLITDLSPKFRIIYATVPLVLALSTRDLNGSISLNEKGLRHFPYDWPILYRGAYIYQFEKNDKSKAAELLIRAQKNGGPSWLVALATRLYTESGKIELAQQLFQDYQKTGLSTEILSRIKARILEYSNHQK